MPDHLTPLLDSLALRAEEKTQPSIGREEIALLTREVAELRWEGPWTEPNVPLRARYRHTHWVAAARSNGSIGVFDINCMSNGSGVGIAGGMGSLGCAVSSSSIAARRAPRASGI